ncbi:hypothetical protein [Desulfovibrio litoralis]|uniref:Uncharacterized protein n=1 Tax=Desulfovibrio litoralis DSM 11393 TaxID=1121455 RepID=A0A1M7S5W9_9BACT|nr:hypothetical protein [Desulfovibrio litoralis]SHN53866.1 hypothetical protein SAMN02745728_00464 [Desulfovibrio litoralis DSM 11393]
MQVKCLHCSAEFTTTPKKYLSGKSVYCSKECYSQSRKKTTIVYCKLCGKILNNQKRKSRLYCSKSCAAQAKLLNGNIKKKCRMCNKIFYGKNITELFCSAQCNYLFNNGTEPLAPVFIVEETEYFRQPDPNLGF